MSLVGGHFEAILWEQIWAPDQCLLEAIMSFYWFPKGMGMIQGV